MILEQVIQGVSNRCPSEDSFISSLEIESAVKSVLNAPKKTEPSKKISLEKKETTEAEDKKSLDKELKEEVEDLREQYGLLEEQNILGVDYENLFSYLERQVNPEEIYAGQEESETEESSSVMSDEEAEKTVQKIQLGYLTGDKDNVSYEEKEKFHHWQEFNKTLLMVYHQLSPIRSDNVNYAAFN